jgi:F-type H+-transporting ATPase subunit a
MIRATLLLLLGLSLLAVASPVWAQAAHPAAPPAPTIQGESAESDEPPELPNAIGLLYRGSGEHGRARPAWIGWLYRFQDIVYALIVAGALIAIVRLGTRRMTLIPGGVQNAIESFVEGFRDFILSILGPAGEPYVPFLGSLFLYIWFMNLIGLVPLMKSPTSALSTTAALALCVFLYVQWIGLRRLGPLRYFKHLAGDPQDAIGWGMVPLILPIHVIGELARPVSLSLRLFGNILGEDVLIGIFAGLGVAVVAFLKLPVGIPLHLPFILLAMLMSTVQALVFTLLSTVYIMQVLPHEDDGAGHGPQAEGI